MYQLCQRLNDCIEKANKPYQDLLLQITELLLDTMQMFGLHNSSTFALYRDTLIRHIRDAYGRITPKQKYSKAIDVAVKYHGRERLCELVYEGGPQYYAKLIE
jgi:hypothetical protein